MSYTPEEIEEFPDLKHLASRMRKLKKEGEALFDEIQKIQKKCKHLTLNDKMKYDAERPAYNSVGGTYILVSKTCPGCGFVKTS